MLEHHKRLLDEAWEGMEVEVEEEPFFADYTPPEPPPCRDGWEGDLQTKETKKDGLVLADTDHNLILVQQNAGFFRGKIAFNEMHQDVTLLEDIDGPYERIKASKSFRPLSNDQLIGIRSILSAPRNETYKGWGFPTLSKDRVNDLLRVASRMYRIHPYKAWLHSNIAEGQDYTPGTLERILIDHAGAEDDPYGFTREATLLFFMGLMDRVHRPGCKFDSVLTLISEQGAAKQQFAKLVAGGDRFYTLLKHNLNNEQKTMEQLKGAVVAEHDEVASVGRSGSDAWKSHVSQTTNKARPAFGIRVEYLDRSTVEIASSNLEQFMMDGTGNRRILPIRVKKFDMVALRKLLPQLLAEAYDLYKALYVEHFGTLAEVPVDDEDMGALPLYIDPDTPAGRYHAVLQQQIEVETEVDILHRVITDYLESPLRLDDLCDHAAWLDREFTNQHSLVRPVVVDYHMAKKILEHSDERAGKKTMIRHALDKLEGWVRYRDYDRRPGDGETLTINGKSLHNPWVRESATHAQILKGHFELFDASGGPATDGSSASPGATLN